MKSIALKVVLVVALVVSAGVAGFMVGEKHADGKPVPLANNTLRWVRDPNIGTLYYGWYEPDGSQFNYVATASRNHRMGDVAESNVPAHRWVQVD